MKDGRALPSSSLHSNGGYMGIPQPTSGEDGGDDDDDDDDVGGGSDDVDDDGSGDDDLRMVIMITK